MTHIKSSLSTTPVTTAYFVMLQQGAPGFNQYQGKTGLVRSIRSDGFLEVDFSCSGTADSVFLDAYQLVECAPPHNAHSSMNRHTVI